MSTEITTVYESGLNLHDICKFYQENWPRKIALQLETFINGTLK